MSVVPFSGMFTANLPAANNKHRLKLFRRFLGWDKVPEGLRVLDVGASNFIGRELGITDFTHGDLNRVMEARLEDYDVILCFEVINHLFNHGVLLENISKRLKAGGKLYLSTPRLGLIAWAHGRGNYVELKPRSMWIILEYFGFRVVRYRVCNPWPFRFVFYGFLQPFRFLLKRSKGEAPTPPGAPRMTWYYFGLRPVFRFLLNRFMLFECEKI